MTRRRPDPVAVALFALIVAAACSGCIDGDGAAPAAMDGTQGPEGRSVSEADVDRTAVIRLVYSVPPTGAWGNVSAAFGYGVGVPDGFQVVAMVGGFTSTARPASYLGYLAAVDWPSRYGDGHVAISGVGHEVGTPGLVPNEIRDELDGSQRVRHSIFAAQFTPDLDLRTPRGLEPADDLYYEVVAVFIPHGTRPMPLSLEVAWDGGPARAAWVTDDNVVAVASRDLVGTSNVAAGPAYGAIDAHASVPVAPGPEKSLLWFVPPTHVASGTNAPLSGTAYVERPDGEREQLDPDRAGHLYVGEAPGTWRMGYDRAVQADNWDRTALVAAHLPSLKPLFPDRAIVVSAG